LGDALDIHQDGACIVVARQHVEHVAEIDIGHVAHRDQVREAEALRGAPVGKGGQHCARLRDRRDPSGLEIARAEGRVQPEARGGIADAIGPEHAQQVRLGRQEQALAPAGVDLARIAPDSRTAADHHAGLGAARAEFDDQARHRGGRRHDDGEVGRRRQLGKAAQHRTAGNRAALEVHQMDVAPEAARQKVARHRRADRAGTLAGADGHHRLGCNQFIEVASGHGFVPSPTIEPKP
jgi:hypothetical protein